MPVRRFSLRRWALVLVLSVLCLSAAAAEFSVGAVGSVSISPYKSYDTRVLPLPFVSYKGDRFFIRGTSLGAFLFKNETHEVGLGLSYLGMEFRPSRTDDKALKRLDKRHATMTADLSYSLVSPVGLFRAGLSQDVLGKSEGMTGNLSYHLPWITDCFIIMPGVGVQWASSKHNEYYYGVSRHESFRSGLDRYAPGRTFSPYVTLETKVNLGDRFDFVAKGKLEYLNGRVRHSPMVGRDYLASFMAGVQYSF